MRFLLVNADRARVVGVFHVRCSERPHTDPLVRAVTGARCELQLKLTGERHYMGPQIYTLDGLVDPVYDTKLGYVT